MTVAKKRSASREEGAEKGWGRGGPSGRCHPRARGGSGGPLLYTGSGAKCGPL